MPVPGLAHAYGGDSRPTYTFSNDSVVDFWVEIGSPLVAVNYIAYVPVGVTISGGVGASALDFSQLVTGSKVLLINNGRIQGQGGAGGQSGRAGAGAGTGGGGGAGQPGGAGGEGDPDTPLSAGSPGTATAGGDAGTVVDTTGGPNRIAADGAVGEDAITIGTGRVALTVINISGEIWAGGGGGGGGGIGFFGGAGGDPGDPGLDGGGTTPPPYNSVSKGFGGVAGYAIRGTPTPTFLSGGSSPNVEGTVGA